MDFHLILLFLHIVGAGVLIGVVIFSLFLAFKKTWSQNRINTLHYIGQFGMWASARLDSVEKLSVAIGNGICPSSFPENQAEYWIR